MRKLRISAQIEGALLQAGRRLRMPRPAATALSKPGGLERGDKAPHEGSMAMKRYLIAIAALGVVFAANSALADNNWAFDDSYWKAQEPVGAVKAPELRIPAARPTNYYLVDDFNP
jgi:hypothetical protein